VPLPSGEIRAAGGLVTRSGPGNPDGTNSGEGAGQVEFLLVHRPKYDDWTFPKGKCDPGETDEDAARREVHEETGFVCTLGAEAGTTRYIDNQDRPKVVRYWHMTVAHGEFVPNREVDRIAWLAPDAARDRLTYEHDRDLLERGR
jgi:8-oxo-dGTP diphosphatase